MFRSTVLGAAAGLLMALDGMNFVLENVQATTDVPLVIQIGKWRRQIKIPSVAACEDQSLDPADVHEVDLEGPDRDARQTEERLQHLSLFGHSQWLAWLAHAHLLNGNVADAVRLGIQSSSCAAW